MSKNRYLNPSSQILFLHHLHSLTLTVRLKIHLKQLSAVEFSFSLYDFLRAVIIELQWT